MTIFLLVFQKLNEKINVIRVDNPAKAPKSLFKNSIHVCFTSNVE